jgi:hypothetical protein
MHLTLPFTSRSINRSGDTWALARARDRANMYACVVPRARPVRDCSVGGARALAGRLGTALVLAQLVWC